MSKIEMNLCGLFESRFIICNNEPTRLFICRVQQRRAKLVLWECLCVFSPTMLQVFWLFFESRWIKKVCPSVALNVSISMGHNYSWRLYIISYKNKHDEWKFVGILWSAASYLQFLEIKSKFIKSEKKNSQISINIYYYYIFFAHLV